MDFVFNLLNYLLTNQCLVLRIDIATSLKTTNLDIIVFNRYENFVGVVGPLQHLCLFAAVLVTANTTTVTVNNNWCPLCFAATWSIVLSLKRLYTAHAWSITNVVIFASILIAPINHPAETQKDILYHGSKPIYFCCLCFLNITYV